MRHNIVTVVELQELVDVTRAAYLAAVKAKSYSISPGGTSRSVQRQELDKLRADLLYWERELQKANAGRRGIPTKFITATYVD